MPTRHGRHRFATPTPDLRWRPDSCTPARWGHRLQRPVGASVCGVAMADRMRQRDRADAAGLFDVGSLDVLVKRADVIVAVCPPAVGSHRRRSGGCAGLRRHLRRCQCNRAGDVTGDRRAVCTIRRWRGHRASCRVGGHHPPVPLAVSPLDRSPICGPERCSSTRLVDGGAGAASAVKMCYAGWTKGSAALLLAIRALAVAEGVDDTMLAEWATSIPGLAAQAERTAGRATRPKAWRFAGELDEIADSFAAHGLPEGFGRAASDVYRRLAGFKDTPGVSLDEVIDALIRPVVSQPDSRDRPPTPPE